MATNTTNKHYFRDFAKEYDFKYITNSPHFPQSNGFIESKVKAIKNTLKRAQQTKADHTDGQEVIYTSWTPTTHESIAGPHQLTAAKNTQPAIK